jgi:hypothetical protein
VKLPREVRSGRGDICLRSQEPVGEPSQATGYGLSERVIVHKVTNGMMATSISLKRGYGVTRIRDFGKVGPKFKQRGY